jgi:hypothetical protein
MVAVPLFVLGAVLILYGVFGVSYCGSAQPESFIGLGIIFLAAGVAVIGQFIGAAAMAVFGVVLSGIGIAGLIAAGCRLV